MGAVVSGRMIRPVEEVVKPAEGASQQHSVHFDMKIFSPFELQNTSQMEMNQRCIRNLRKIAFKHPKS